MINIVGGVTSRQREENSNLSQFTAQNPPLYEDHVWRWSVKPLWGVCSTTLNQNVWPPVGFRRPAVSMMYIPTRFCVWRWNTRPRCLNKTVPISTPSYSTSIRSAHTLSSSHRMAGGTSVRIQETAILIRQFWCREHYRSCDPIETVPCFISERVWNQGPSCNPLKDTFGPQTPLWEPLYQNISLTAALHPHCLVYKDIQMQCFLGWRGLTSGCSPGRPLPAHWG